MGHPDLSAYNKAGGPAVKVSQPPYPDKNQLAFSRLSHWKHMRAAMGQANKPLDIITNEICQMFSALKHEDQELVLDRLEDLMELNKGKESTERFRRMVIAELAKMQTKH